MVKGILKRHSSDSVASSRSQSSDDGIVYESPKQKRVSFDGAEPTRVFEADEWDRSPAEVTLRLTYKDVAELRELNVCLVRTGPLMMERTPSRRPSRQRTATLQRTGSPNRTSPTHGSPFTAVMFDESAPQSPSPKGPRMSPTYEYQSSKSLPPLLEDSTSSTNTPTSEQRGCGPVASSSDSYFTLHPESFSHSPPGLSIPATHLKGQPSPALAPPPLIRSPSPAPHSPSSKLRPLSVVHSSSSHQHILAAPKSLKLSRGTSVPEKLALESGKGVLFPTDSPPTTWKPLSAYASSSSPTLGTGEGQPPRRGVMSLMRWELRRSFGTSGKRGFGLVRKGNASA